MIESILNFGADEIHFILFDRSQFITSLLGSGQRWGGTFRYHFLPSDQPVYPQLSKLFTPTAPDEVILLAQADRLPAIDRALAEPPCAPTFFLTGDGLQDWTGWALVTYEMTTFVSAGADAFQCFTEWRDRTRHTARCFPMQNALRASSFEHLLRAQDRVLGKKHPGIVFTGREVADNVWMGWNATVHRTAKLVSPVYIGENCRIGYQTQLGPDVTVGKGSVVDRFSILTNSMVYAGSYVGEGLEIRDAIVNGNHLVNTRLRTEVHDVDDLLLAHISGLPVGSWLRACFVRLCAAAFLMAASPVILALLAWTCLAVKGWPLGACELLSHPAGRHPERWRSFRQWSLKGNQSSESSLKLRDHFTQVFLPGLWNVLRGDLLITGRTPISPAEAHGLPAEEFHERVIGKAGLIHPQLFMAQAVQQSPAEQVTRELWMRYLAALFYGEKPRGE